jgi:hypothetical protein
MNLKIEFDEEKVKKIIEQDAMLYNIYEAKSAVFEDDKKTLKFIFDAYIEKDVVLKDKYYQIRT